MLRTILAVIAVVIYLIISIPLLLIMTAVRHFAPEKATYAMQRIMQCAMSAVWHIAGARVTTIGQENLPQEGEAVLFVANHQSIFDIVIGYSQMRSRTGFISKNNIEKIPLLHWNMVFLNCLFLNREDIKQGLETIHRAIDLVKGGTSIFIFPEGTRNKGNETELAEFHRGSFKMAQRTGCSIIPVSFNNTSALFERQKPRMKSAHVVVEYGKPVPYASLTREEQKHIDTYFRDVISEMVRKNQELV